MHTCVPRLGGDGHGRGGEILHLLQLEIQGLGLDGQFGHVFFATTGVRGDEVGDDLLAQTCLAIDLVENGFEFVEQTEWWFAHDAKHCIRSMFGRYFQATTDVACDEFAGVFSGSFVDAFILTFVQ